MAQKMRPVADVVFAGWTPTPASPATHFDKLDETVRDDTDFTTSPSAPDGTQPLTIELTAVQDPLTSVGYFWKYVLAKNLSGGATVNVLVELLEGSTVRSSQTHNDIPSTPTEFTLTPTPVEADSIVDHTVLRLRFTPTQV